MDMTYKQSYMNTYQNLIFHICATIYKVIPKGPNQINIYRRGTSQDVPFDLIL